MRFDKAATEMAKEKTSELFAAIEKLCSANEAQGINVGWDGTNCTITNGRISLTVEVDALNGELSVSEWDCRVKIPGEPISGFQFQRKELSKTRFLLDLPSARNCGWREKGSVARPFLSAAELAEKCVRQFMVLEQREENGQIKHEWRGQ